MFYVDYGNTETVSNIFEWDPVCETVSIQAIALNIADMKEIVCRMRLLRNSGICRNNTPMKLLKEFLLDRLYLSFDANIM